MTIRKALRSLGPVSASAPFPEALRAGVGALAGMAIAGLFALSPRIDMQFGLYMIAPFGATSVLLFAVPNSPLAQPWAAIVGNTMAALLGVSACLLIADPALRIAVAVGVTVAATTLCRALHPPAGAVAMTAAMSPDTIAELGFRFALTPVAAGTVMLVLMAAIYARLTGRTYPMRRLDDPNANATADPAPASRVGLTGEQLVELLERHRQSHNLGAQDLARLVGAAELQAAAARLGPVAAQDIMSRDLVTVAPHTPQSRVAQLFSQHRFTSIPVTDAGGRYLGVIFQIHLIRANGAPDDPASRLMQRTGPRASPSTTLDALLAMMANGEVDAVPVLEHDRIIGIVTRTDLISALARQVPG